MKEELKTSLFNIKDDEEFSNIALEIFWYQFNANRLYHDFVVQLGIDPKSVKFVSDIPFLPVAFFKNHKIIPDNLSVDEVFESSMTTGSVVSRHYVYDRKLYEESFLKGFRHFYGKPEEYFIGALLPSYMERKNSSLIYMMNELIQRSRHNSSGFFRDNTEELLELVLNTLRKKQKVILMGVSFALLDMAEKHNPDLSGAFIMETGGMKGRRKELTREELHGFLKKRFNVSSIHSEYGMTELLSQAYSKGEGLFHCPPWMKILIRDPLDPLSLLKGTGKTGGINIIDLANIYSCSFIATGDLGKLHPDGGFEVLGRFDNSDVRGCNLLME